MKKTHSMKMEENIARFKDEADAVLLPSWTPPPVLKLMQYQVDALAYLQAREELGEKTGALFMEMRLGKTLSMVRHLKTLDVKRILIICPFAVMATWRKQLIFDRVSTDDISFVTGDGASKAKRLLALQKDARYYIANFESIVGLNIAAHQKWDCVVIDESYKLASPRSAVNKYIMKHLSQKAGVAYRFLLSGAPAPETEMNYVNQLIWLRGNLFGCDNYWKFRQAHCDRSVPFKDVLLKSSKALLQDAVRRNCFCLNRAQAGVGPAKYYRTVTVKPCAPVARAYRSMRKDWEADGVEVIHELAKMSALCRITSGLKLRGEFAPRSSYEVRSSFKIDALLKLIAEIQVEEPQQIIVWAHLIDEVRMISQAMEATGLDHRVIYGEVPVFEREAIREAFQRRLISVVIMQVQTGIGLDFSAADTAIYFSNALDGNSRIQSEDRVVHLQKTGTVLIVDLVVEGTIDEDIVELLVDKKVKSFVFLNALKKRVGIV